MINTNVEEKLAASVVAKAEAKVEAAEVKAEAKVQAAEAKAEAKVEAAEAKVEAAVAKEKKRAGKSREKWFIREAREADALVKKSQKKED